MVTPINLIQNAKTDFGHNEKDALVIAAQNFTGMRSTMRNRLAVGSEHHKKVLEALLQDCLKKRFETAKNLAIKRARKRAQPDENSDAEDKVSDGSEDPGTAVAFWVGNPEIGGHRDINGWIWDVRNRRNMGVIENKTLDGIWNMVKADVPTDRKVHQILEALEGPMAAVLTFLPDYMSLNSDAQVRAFFQITQAKPVRIFILLHSVPPRANTLLPAGAKPYFDLDRFNPLNEYDDFAKDSDANIRNITGHELRARVARQEETLREVKREHKRLFPNAGIIDSDDKDYCYIWCLKRPKCTTGPQLIKARQVVGERRRATQLNRHLGVRRFVSKVRGLNAAQHAWEALNDGGYPARKLQIDYGAPKTPRSAAHPSRFAAYPLSSAVHPSSSAAHPSSSIAHPSSSAAHPSSSAVHPSSSRQQSSPPPLSTSRGQPRTHYTESSAGDMPSDAFSLNSEGHT
ncbi:hypothetical protein BGX38DRAFT_1277596 [Terfezia claveryi]|nr:hypothetical protein BGX38DRAFT_1277596 [Terfezia claveryi]